MRGLRCSKSVVSYARAGSSLRGSRSCASGTRVFRIPLCLMFGCKVGCVEWARGGMVVGEMCHICIGRMCVERVLCHKPVVRPSIPAASASRDLCVCFPVAQCPRECGPRLRACGVIRAWEVFGIRMRCFVRSLWLRMRHCFVQASGTLGIEGFRSSMVFEAGFRGDLCELV